DDDRIALQIITYVAKRKDHGFLEMIALHQPMNQGGVHAAWALAKADAPQWPRVVVFLRRGEVNRFTHGEAESSKLSFKHNPGKMYGWLEKYIAQLPKDSGMRLSAEGDLKFFRSGKIPPSAAGNALPPL